MNIELSRLLALQELNNKITDCRNNIDALNASVKNKREEVEMERKKTDEIKEETTRNKKEEDRRELDLKTNEEDINKLLIQLNQAKSNEEYSALNKRINEERRQDSGLEDEILELMTRNDELKARVEELQKSTAALEAELSQMEKKAGTDVAAYEKEIEEMQNRCKAIEAEVDSELIDKYHRVLERNLGDAMAVADGVALVCRGCNMSIPRQRINEILKDDAIIFCKSCNRILYIPEDE